MHSKCTIDELMDLTLRVADSYRTLNLAQDRQPWGVTEYVMGLAGDTGDLVKLIMAKQNLRSTTNLDARLDHELSDCLWSILVIASELGIDLTNSYKNNMATLLAQIESSTLSYRQAPED